MIGESRGSMPTDVSIDDQLLAEAHRLGGRATKKATVTEALHEYIRHRKQAKIVELFGTIDFDPTHDHKKQRRNS
jgi:Arc/MetJ family transcription regulator